MGPHAAQKHVVNVRHSSPTINTSSLAYYGRGMPRPYVMVMVKAHHSSPITHHQSLITNHSSPITHHQSLITHHTSHITGSGQARGPITAKYYTLSSYRQAAPKIYPVFLQPELCSSLFY